MKPERWFDQERAENFTGRNRVTLWHWRAIGKIAYKKVGNQVFYPISALRKFRAKGGETHAEQAGAFGDPGRRLPNHRRSVGVSGARRRRARGRGS